MSCELRIKQVCQEGGHPGIRDPSGTGNSLPDLLLLRDLPAPGAASKGLSSVLAASGQKTKTSKAHSSFLLVSGESFSPEAIPTFGRGPDHPVPSSNIPQSSLLPLQLCPRVSDSYTCSSPHLHSCTNTEQSAVIISPTPHPLCSLGSMGREVQPPHSGNVTLPLLGEGKKLNFTVSAQGLPKQAPHSLTPHNYGVRNTNRTGAAHLKCPGQCVTLG